jgi:hypothetical protein
MPRANKPRWAVAGADEYNCQCPRCLTLETLWFKGDALVPRVKFNQPNKAEKKGLKRTMNFSPNESP